VRVARFLLLSLLGVAALVVSAFSNWIADRAATEIPVADLFGLTDDAASFGVSIGLVLLVVAAVGLVATLVVSRVLQAIAGVVGLVVAGDWIFQALVGDVSIGDIRLGAWLALGGSVLLVLASWLGRRPRPAKAASASAARPAR
jgi:hypothetical protein